MDVSIIIVSYNTAELIADCLNSIKSSSQKLKIETFVVDNNSIDDTVSSIEKNYPWVKLMKNKSNVGFSKANNQALKKATGKYFLILNPDTKLSNDTLSKMFEFLETKKDITVATCRVELPNGNLDRDCRRRFPTPWRAFTYFSKLSKLFPRSKTFDSYQMGYVSQKIEHEVDSCVGAFMFVRSSAVKKVGYFDEDFFFYGEDLDWCWRFKEARFKIVYTPITKIIHYKGAASGMKTSSANVTKASKESKKRALYESVHAMEIFYKKHYLHKYPFFVSWLMLMSFKFLEKFRTLSV